MNYTYEQFISDVKAEAIALKQNATKEELSRITESNFSPNYQESCIYGLATGDCLSLRASELIFLCCKRFFYNINQDEYKSGFETIKEQVNGKTIEGVNDAISLQQKRDWAIKYFSSIEAYILTPEAKNKNLIEFLNGTREDLDL